MSLDGGFAIFCLVLLVLAAGLIAIPITWLNDRPPRGPGVPSTWVYARCVGVGSMQYRIPGDGTREGYWCDDGGLEIDYSRRDWLGRPGRK